MIMLIKRSVRGCPQLPRSPLQHHTMVLVSRPPLIGIIVGRNRCVARPPTPPTPPMPPSHPKTNRRLSNTQRTGLFRHERHAAAPREIVKHIRTHSACWLMHISHTQTRCDDTGGHLNSTHACMQHTYYNRARAHEHTEPAFMLISRPPDQQAPIISCHMRACVRNFAAAHTHTHWLTRSVSLFRLSASLPLCDLSIKQYHVHQHPHPHPWQPKLR